MNDLRRTLLDFEVLSDAYARRALNNGPGHVDNDYLHRQADRFHTVAVTIRNAILDARNGPAKNGAEHQPLAPERRGGAPNA